MNTQNIIFKHSYLPSSLLINVIFIISNVDKKFNLCYNRIKSSFLLVHFIESEE